MRVAIISDIHANLPALESTLAYIEDTNVDAIHCLGDIVGYGPFPNECVDLVRARCKHVVKGNHDSGLAGETSIQDFNQYGRKAIEWTADVITPENLEYLRSLPYSVVENGYTLVHSSPVQPEEWTYVLSRQDAELSFDAFTTDLCFIGHTHVPLIVGEDLSVNKFRKGLRYLINVGSIGQPRDGNPQAAFGLLNTEGPNYELIRVPYDVERTAKAIDDAGLPAFLAHRLFQGM